MRTRTFNKPLGTDAQTDYLQQTHRLHDELQFFDSTTVKVEQTTRGVRWHAKIPPATAGGKAKSDYAGLWVSGQSYDALEWVVVQDGSYAGAYISTADDNSHAPYTGIDWVQFSALPQWF